MTQGEGLNSRFSTMVRHRGRLGTVIQTVFSFGFFLFFTGDVSLRTNPPPPLEWISSPPLVSAVLITTKGDESPGSSRMGVIGALVIFFFHLRSFRINFTSNMSTGDWDLFLGPLEWARAETGGADRWVL